MELDSLLLWFGHHSLITLIFIVSVSYFIILLFLKLCEQMHRDRIQREKLLLKKLKP